MDLFTRSLDELLNLSTQKKNLINHLKKNYKENIHYIIQQNNYQNSKRYGDKIK